MPHTETPRVEASKPHKPYVLEGLRLSVAPMMDWTDTHCRVFHRVLAPGARLYYRGKPVDLAPFTRGDVATVELK